MNTIRRFTKSEDLARAAASAWVAEIRSAHAAGRPHCVALSGGRIANPLFECVVERVQSQGERLDHVHFFWADERCVPPDHLESNYRVAQELLFSPLRIPAVQIHRIRGEEPPERAAALATDELCRIIPAGAGDQPVLDLIFLGLGEDGHVASLFPGEPDQLAHSEKTFRPVLNSPKPPPERITMGYRVIESARQVWMLASGQGKSAALFDSLAQNARTPFGRVLQNRRATVIFTDVTGPFEQVKNAGFDP